jgi:RimJ/RimL family protein N-acetyltransferase/catechol 2,3-dioxygenase-like lactoylglutathione lyase family enzyme
MHVIEAGRFTLEPQVAAHAEEMFAVLSDPAIYEYENEPPPSLEWLRERFTKLETRRSADGLEQWLNWVIRLPTSELIGYVQGTVHSNGRAAIAYELSSKYWGRGLASQAVQAMITELVERYQVRSLSAVLKRENHRSRRLLEGLGFSPASPELHAACRVEPGELLMHREDLRTGMLHHLSFGVSDLHRAAGFYDAVLSALGYVRVWSDATAIGYGCEGGGDKLAIKLSAGGVVPPRPRFHVALAAPSREAVARFHAAALKHGGRDNGAPGLRPEYGENYYAAFVIDPDGYRVEAVIDAPA